MSLIQTIRRPINDQQRAELVFAGQLVVFENLSSMSELIDFTRELITSCFDSDQPQAVHEYLHREQFLHIAHDAQEGFRISKQTNELLIQCLEQTGVNLNNCYRDKLVLRILPPVDSHPGGRHSDTHIHRDTWGSNIYQQINWWAPVYPLHKDNTLAIYPEHWNKPIENNTDTWDFSEVKRNRKQAPQHLAGKIPAAPVAISETDKHNEIRVLINPGSLLCFSGAHLHGGLANTTDQTRFSIESRTINYDDILNGRKAPNIDCEGGEQHSQWFRHALDNTNLTDVM